MKVNCRADASYRYTERIGTSRAAEKPQKSHLVEHQLLALRDNCVIAASVISIGYERHDHNWLVRWSKKHASQRQMKDVLRTSSRCLPTASESSSGSTAPCWRRQPAPTSLLPERHDGGIKLVLLTDSAHLHANSLCCHNFRTDAHAVLHFSLPL